MRNVIAAVVLLLIAVACGQGQAEAPPDSGEQTTEVSTPAATGGTGAATAGAPTEDQSPLAAVQEELEGLSGQARTERLVELAEAEGALTWYGSVSTYERINEVFAEEYGLTLDINAYRGGANEVRIRILEEQTAGHPSADVVWLTAAEMVVLEEAGLLAPLRTPATEEVRSDAVQESSVWPMYLVLTPMWNTDLVSPEEVPADLEQLFGNEDFRLLMESRQYDWFATLVEDHFMADKGMTREEAIALFEKVASRAMQVQGNLVVTELLAAGEADITAATYSQFVPTLQEEGAPVAIQPVIEPMVVEGFPIAVMNGSEHPAAALLYIEFLLSARGQQLLKDEFHYEVTSSAIPSELLDEYEYKVMDRAAIHENREEWQDLYERVLRGAEAGAVAG